MHIQTKPLFSLTVLSICLLASILIASAQATEQKKSAPGQSSVSDSEREKIEAVVRDYLLKNPSLLREMIDTLRAYEERERSDRAAGALKTYKDQIYNDAASPGTANPTGEITFLAFVDYNCGYCRTNVPLVGQLAEKDKMIRLVYKDLPILGPNSEVAARAAVAAHRQGRYLEFHDALFRSNGAGGPTVKTVAASLGIDYAALSRDMADKKVLSAIGRTRSLAAALGIDGTPAYIIGTQVIPGAVDIDVFSQIVAEERAKLVKVDPAKPPTEPK